MTTSLLIIVWWMVIRVAVQSAQMTQCPICQRAQVVSALRTAPVRSYRDELLSMDVYDWTCSRGHTGSLLEEHGNPD